MFTKKTHAESAEGNSNKSDRQQTLPYRPLSAHEYVLAGCDKDSYRVITHQRAHGFGQYTDGIHDRGEPEPKLNNDAKKLADITKKYIKHPKTNTQADGKNDQDGDNRNQRQINQAGEVAGNQQENTEQAKYNEKI